MSDNLGLNASMAFFTHLTIFNAALQLVVRNIYMEGGGGQLLEMPGDTRALSFKGHIQV